MPRIAIKIFLIFFIVVLPDRTVLEAQHPSWQNFTTRDGLPSNEIYAMKEDSRGFLWFGTDQGICRYNGYEFARPIDTSATASGAAFQIVEDAWCRIWYIHLDATLSFVESDTIRSWQYNHIPKLIGKKQRSTLRFAVAGDATVWMPFLYTGFVVVHQDGSQQVIPAKVQTAILFTTLDGQTICSQVTGKADQQEQLFQKRSEQTSEVFRLQDGSATALGRFPVEFLQQNTGVSFSAWRLNNGDFICCNYQTFYLIHDNRLIWHGQKDVFANEIFEDTDGAILLASRGGTNKGLLRFSSLAHFMRNEFVNILPGRSVAYALRDHEGGWWAATTDAGVFYCKNPRLDILDAFSGLPSDDVMRLTTDGAKMVYAGLRTLNISAFDLQNGRITAIPNLSLSGNSEITALCFDTLYKRLWCGPHLSFLEKNRWKSVKYLSARSTGYNNVLVKKITPDPFEARWWASSHAGFFSINPSAGSAFMIPQDSLAQKRTFSVTSDFDGNIWVTTLDGLRCWRNGRYELPAFYHPALRFQANCVEFLPDSTMVIALRGAGLLIRDKGGHFTHLTRGDGLTADYITDLDITPEGMIYGCSNAGLNILTRQRNHTWHIETVTVKQGLPSDQVNDVVFLNGEIWIATNKGIARFKEKPAPAPMPAPQLEQFRVNNRDAVFTSNVRLSHEQNNITLRFFSLHFRSDGDILYRYRLVGAETTLVYTHTREVNIANLSPGKYRFEVQAQNEDGQWSEPSRWPFQICPPWWATWWFRMLVSATLIAGAYLFYRNRVRAVRQEAALREKVHEMETAALRAQMNPHFIFNCLQAIQSFIAKNDRDAAAAYLARFAKLVRLALHSSVDGRHGLTEEMAMLENYLYLEQLRFGGTFCFTVHVEDGLDPADITLPPLLVQPFVENALLHGLQGKESSGRIEVLFARKGGQLEVSVTDNGAGFSEGKAADARPHKSVGMMLTQKRLDLLAGIRESGEERLVRETVRDENGIVVGAKIRIWIPLME